jgi:pimeloyl-ACP methyl ester carboxylesterase
VYKTLGSKLNFIVLFLFFCFCFIPKSEAFELTNKEEYWEFNEGSGQIYKTEEDIRLEQSGVTDIFPYIRSITPLEFLQKNSSLLVSIQYTSLNNFGTGLMMTKNLPPKHLASDTPSNRLFYIWNDGPGGLGLYSWVCPNDMQTCSLPYKLHDLGRANFNVNHFNFINENGKIVFEVNNVKLGHYVNTDELPRFIWIGNPEKTSSTDHWSNFVIKSIYSTTTSTTPEEKTPIVVIPGMGASVDYEALLSGNDGTNWHVPEYVNAYDNLINSLTDQGYEIDKDLHVFAYDWRKPILDNADKLSAYLLSLGIDSENKAQFVSHSMGGLVARSYLEKYGNGNISKLITVGTPRQGSTDAYPLWQAGKTFDNIWWANAVLSVASLTDRNWSDKPIETLRKNIPSIAQILPTFDHISMNNSLVPVDSMKHKNTFLPKPPIPDGLDNMIDVIYGTDIETKQVIKTEVRTRIDRMWGVWDDGKPIKKNPFVYGQGDGTVLAMSAVSNANNLFELSLDHTDLIWNEVGVTKILERLGLEINPSLVLDTPDNNSEFVSVALRSPGRLSVCKENICDDDLGYMSDDKKVALLPTGAGNYQIVVTSTGDSGDYGLSVDSGLDLLDRAIIHGHLTSGKQDVYEAVVSESGDVSILPDTDTLHDSIRRVWDQIRVIEKNFDKKLAVTKSLSATTKDRYRLTQLSRLELIYLLSRSYKYGTDETTRLGLELWRLLDIDDESFWQDKSVSYPKYKHDLMYKVRSRLSDLILKTGKFSDDNILLAHAISESHDLLSDLDDLDPKTQTGLYKAKINSVDSWLLLSLKVRHVK